MNSLNPVMRIGRQIVDGMRAAVDDRQFNVKDAPVIELDVDPIRLREVVTNLLTNAVRATEDGGAITVEVMSEAEKLA